MWKCWYPFIWKHRFLSDLDHFLWLNHAACQICCIIIELVKFVLCFSCLFRPNIFFSKNHITVVVFLSEFLEVTPKWEKPMVFWNGLSGIYISPVPTQFHPVVQLTSFQPSQNPDFTKFHIHVFQFWYIKLKLNMWSLWRTTSKCHWLRHKLLLSKDLMFRHHYWLFSTRVIFPMYNITH